MPQRDAWFLDPVLTADMADEPVGGLLDMSELVLQDQNLNVSAGGGRGRQQGQGKGKE